MTGYTAPLLNGEITTLEEFANVCSKAFGFCYHLNDVLVTSNYVPASFEHKISYYKENIHKLAEEIRYLESSPKNVIEENRKKYIKGEIVKTENEIALNKMNEVRLADLIEELNKKVFPEHLESTKNYMLKQLEDTIENDCNTYYIEASLDKLKGQYKHFNVEVYIEDTIRTNKVCIKDMQQHIRATINRIVRSNKMAEEFFNIFRK